MRKIRGILAHQNPMRIFTRKDKPEGEMSSKVPTVSGNGQNRPNAKITGIEVGRLGVGSKDEFGMRDYGFEESELNFTCGVTAG